jgi:hypothetical protein
VGKDVAMRVALRRSTARDQQREMKANRMLGTGFMAVTANVAC